MKTILLLLSILFAVGGASAQERYHGGFELPGLCDLVARDLVLSIVAADRQGIVVERSDRYQQMRGNPHYKGVNIPRLLAKTKDLQMTGAGYRDLVAHARVECGKESRGLQ